MSPVRRAFAILSGVAIIVAIGLLIAQDQVTMRVRSAVSAEDPRYTSYVAALMTTDMSAGNDFDVLTNGVQIFPAMLSAIEGARHRISFETYIFDTGQMADQFTAALARAAERRVTVNLLIDAIGASRMQRKHVEQLRKAGCHVAEFNSPTWYSLPEVNYRTHRKILVVDGEVAFTGGVSVGDHWMGDADSKEHWRDTQVRIRGPIVRLIEGAFYENYIEADGPDPPILDPAPLPTGDNAPAVLARSSPNDGSGDLKKLYLLCLAAATRSIDITSPYFVTDESTMWSLEDAVKRGVKIRVLVEGDITDAMPVKYASRYVYERLLQLGIEVYEYQPTMMHAKVLIVDDIWSMFGSANFDNRSLELNDELNVAVSSRKLAARFLADFAKDLKESKQLKLEEWRHRSKLSKARETFWMAFSEVF